MVIARSMDPLSDPNIYISTKDDKPDKKTNEIACDTNGLDICSVPYSLLKEKSKIYIGIQCSGNCTYFLRTSYRSNNADEIFTIGNYLYEEFNSGDPKVIRFNVPQDTTIN